MKWERWLLALWLAWVVRDSRQWKRVMEEPYAFDDGTTAAVEATVRYKWNPHRDISVYELALALPYLVIVPYGMGVHDIEVLPEQVKRHFHKFIPGVKVYGE